MPCEELSKLVSQSKTLSEILTVFGLDNKGGNARTLKRRLNEENISFNHIKLGKSSNKGKKFPDSCMTKEECLSNVFVNPCSYSRKTIKRYILKYDFMPYECDCGLKNEWKNKKLSLQLEHKDGNGKNNTFENLKWLCPNCHSQTETFAGRSLRKLKPVKASILNPNWRHQSRLKNRKVERPSKEELFKLTNTLPMIRIGKMFGVSDNAIRKWCKSYQIM